MRKEEREKKRRIRKERRRDEESLYYILERDLDREAIFREHDGWYSQVSFGKGKRIDYVVKYGNRIYGIEVKTGVPKPAHFNQAKKYCNALNGVFLAYPSDRVGEAVYVSEIKEQKYIDVGLISLTLFRSHIIRKAERCERQSEQIWKNGHFDEKEYERHVKTFSWERSDGLPATVLKDGCFWISFAPSGKESDERHYRLPFNPSDWKGLGLLYGAGRATTLRRCFSIEYLSKINKKLGWKSFNLWRLVQCDLADARSYGDHLWMFGLSLLAHFLLGQIRETLEQRLGKEEWKKLTKHITEWKKQNKMNQSKHEKEFIKLF